MNEPSGSGEIMFQKFVFAFVILALALAFAGTVPAPGSSYKISLVQPSVVNGTDLKAGEYKLTLGADKVTILVGKTNVDVPAKFETVEKKFETTAIHYTVVNGKSTISEIRLGGTKTRVLFQ
jgi:hypothetical protein